MLDSFKQKLEQVADDSQYTTFTNAATILYSFEIFKRYLCPGSILELGPAEGLMTEKLRLVSNSLTIVEGSEQFCHQLKRKFNDQIKIENCMFEEFSPETKYDNIVLGHVLEHVTDPVQILRLATTWLTPSGVVLSAVPNARSIHRQAAVKMGLLKSIFDMSAKDVHHGHMRVFSPETFESIFLQADYEIIAKGGYWLKPLSDRQIEETWTPEMLNAFMQLGEFYPDIAAELFIVGKARVA